MTDLLKAIFENQVVAFIIVVGVVIFVHEFGHFFAARLFGIQVEEFSLGFGPRAFGFRVRETEYKVCWLPLGGYVRMYGSDIGVSIPAERRHLALQTAALYKRVFVSAAGPAMNLILTFVVMSFLSATGIEKLPTQVSVVPGSVAAQSGLPDGATITSLDGILVRTWEELAEKISKSSGAPVRVGYTLDSEKGEAVVVPIVSNEETVYGEKVRVGRIGVTPYFLSSSVVVKKGGLFETMGIKTGDKITHVGSQSVNHFHEIARLLAKMPQPPAVVSSPQSVVKVEREGAVLEFPWTGVAPLQSVVVDSPFSAVSESDLGIVSTDLMFSEPSKNAQESRTRMQWRTCGLGSGVALLGMDGYGPVRSRVQIADWIEKAERGLGERYAKEGVVPLFEAKLNALKRDGVEVLLECSIAPREGRDHLNRKKLFLDFPTEFASRSHTASPIVVRSESFWEAIDNGFLLTWEMGKNIADSVYKLVTGRIPFSNLGGPVEIARVAGSAAKVGWQAFVGMIAFISINVGILNLLPIPVLDGGTLLLLGVEAAYGKTLPVKVQEYVLRAGVFFILILVVLVLYNDVLRRLAH
jgi:regulator of sigma E protease